MKKIGFIGLGNMGFFMSRNLSLSGYEVNGYDINQDVFKNLNPNKGKIQFICKKLLLVGNECFGTKFLGR